MEPIEEDDEFRDEEEEVEPEPPPPPLPVVAAPPKNRGGRPRKHPPTANAGNPAANAPKPVDTNAPETWPSDAEVMWVMLLDWLKNGAGQGRPMGPEAIRIDLKRLTTGYQTGAPVPLNPPIFGELVAGTADLSPGDTLREHITDYYHLPLMRGPAHYKVEFKWRHNSKGIRTGDLQCNSPSEIQALRQAQAAFQRHREDPQGVAAPPPPPGYFPPPPQRGYPQPQQPQYPGYPPPPQYPYAQVDSRTQELEFELARSREREAANTARLDEMQRAIREGRQPNLDPVAPSQSSEIVTTLVETLVRLGVITPGKPIGVAAAPVAAPVAPAAAPPAPPAPPEDPLAGIERIVNAFGRLKKVVRTVETMTGDYVEPPTAEVVPEPDPNAGMEWEAMDTGGTFPDGSKIRFAKNKKTGGVSWAGVVFENGYVGGKLMDLGESVIKPIGEAAQKIMNGAVMTQQAPPPQEQNGLHQAEVVRNIPNDAQEVPAS